MEKLLSTTEAAKELGITVARVQTLIWENRLPAFKVGRSYAIKQSDLELVRERKPGRPTKPKTETNQTQTSKEK
jgi:excisionase family DNA binding protein